MSCNDLRCRPLSSKLLYLFNVYSLKKLRSAVLIWPDEDELLLPVLTPMVRANKMGFSEAKVPAAIRIDGRQLIRNQLPKPSGRSLQGVPQNVPYAPSHYAPIRAFSILQSSASVRA
jgi:hypothetical protein